MSDTQQHPDAEDILSITDKAAARKKMEGLVMPAVDAVEELITDGVGGVKLSAAKTVLEFVFGTKAEKEKDDFLENMFKDLTKPKE